jgi:hypothetical protein
VQLEVKKALNMKTFVILGLVVFMLLTGVSMSTAASTSPSEARGTVVSYTVQSAHNYANNYDYTWTVTKAGATSIRLYIYRYQVETNYDYIYIYDKVGTQLASYTSSTSKYYVWTPYATGDTIKIRLKTDSSITYYGFQVTKYEYNAGTGDTTAPTVSITAPSNGATVSGTYTITASASDNVGVTQVDFYVDSVLKGSDTSSPYSYAWATTAYANGAHSIYAKAKDAAGNVGTSTTVSVTVSNTVVDDGGALTNGVAANGNMDSADVSDMWYIDVAANAASFYAVLTCGTSDFDLYGKFNAQPTTSVYDWRGYTSGGEECTVTSPAQGRHYIMVQYYSGSGAYQLTVTITYGGSGSTWGTGGKYAIIVGISDYASISDLSYCDEDATDFYNFMTAKGYECHVYGDTHTANYPRYDGTANEATVRAAMQGLAAHAVAGNSVAFITSGHGSGDGAGSSYLCMYDCSGSTGCYYDTELAADMGLFAIGVKAFIFIDHCYSGGMGPELMNLANKANIYCTTTCTANGYGYDDPTHSNGMWTYYFLDYGWIQHFASSATTALESIFTYSAAAYPKTGGDAPMQFDGNTGASYTI